ncbi:hypothetical protein Tco_0725680 [Tanacetum coccineum]|uniref:Uncharacterized protein n=1 Tax=Tanacetum coccineum TaxID=301880 RepID=A0ABQ4YDM1_9ASTR
MNSTQAQQKALDDALVAPADRFKYGKCNMRLKTYIKPKEATFQVVLGALAITLFYQAFLITTEIFPKVPVQRFEEVEHDILSFLRDLGHSGDIHYITDVENKDTKKTNKMLYPRFTKVIIDYFMSKDQSISRRNKMFWHTSRDDTMFTSMRCVSRHEKTQVYGAILPQHLTNQATLESIAYQTYYAYASGEKAQKEKYVRKKAESDTSPKKKTDVASKGSRLKSSAKVAKTDKKKQPATMPKTKGLGVLSEVALTEAEQIKLATKRSKTQFHISHTSGLGDGVNTQSKVPDEQQQKTFSQDKEDADEETDVNDDSDETESDNHGDDLTHPNLSTYKADDDEEEEKANDEEMSSDQRVSTPPEYELTEEEEEEENKEGDDKDKEGEQEQDNEDDLYRDVNINLERSDAEMTNAQANQDTDDTHVTLTTVPPVSHTLVNVPVSVTAETPSFDTTIPPPPILIIQPLQQTPESTTTTTIPTTTFPDIPNFTSLFQFDQRVFVLETEMSEFKQTNQFSEAVSSISGIVDNYLASKMKETVDVAVQLQTNKLREEDQAENHEFLNQVDSTMKAIIKEQVQAQVSKIMPKIEKYVTESLEAEVLVRSTYQPQTSYAVAASLSEFEMKKILIDKMETNKSIDRGRDDQDKDEDPSVGSNRGSKRRRSGKEAESSKEPTHKESKSTSSSKEHSHQEFNTGNDDVIPVRETLKDASQWNPLSTQSSFNEFLATPIDFSAFIINWLKIDNLTQEVLTGPTYDLVKGTCKSVVELEYHLEEVFKATNDRLDWHNPEGKPYPHDLSKPLPLIQNERGRQVIPWDYFINNDLEYLKGGSSSQKYTTSVTKTKAADYGQVKWIEDKVSRIWSLFREGDFKRLHRQDIKDMLLLFVQNKLTNLNLEERYALNVALRMFTRRIVIQECVEDLQLGVKSYQKKINLKKPDTYRSDLRRMTPYIAYPDIQVIIYEMNRNRLMRTDELHKFSDGTLNHVRTALNDIATGLEMDYLLKRKWSKQDKQRARVMINAIDKKLRDR